MPVFSLRATRLSSFILAGILCLFACLFASDADEVKII